MINNNIFGYLAIPIVMLIELTADSSIGPQNTLILLQPLDVDGKVESGISSDQY